MFVKVAESRSFEFANTNAKGRLGMRPHRSKAPVASVSPAFITVCSMPLAVTENPCLPPVFGAALPVTSSPGGITDAIWQTAPAAQFWVTLAQCPLSGQPVAAFPMTNVYG